MFLFPNQRSEMGNWLFSAILPILPDSFTKVEQEGLVKPFFFRAVDIISSEPTTDDLPVFVYFGPLTHFRLRDISD